MTSMYFRNAHGVILIYDTTDYDSFRDLTRWKKEIEKVETGSVMILVGTKTDKQNRKVISYEKGQDMARQLGCVAFFETSSKTSDGVNDAFAIIIQSVFEHFVSSAEDVGMGESDDIGFGGEDNHQEEKEKNRNREGSGSAPPSTVPISPKKCERKCCWG
eukprot:TRINITY_DN704_c0_g1_i1.p1 TRINITY_DN704_c0_g1~~TRINITY_DN704_c0_g1_i1.p1  ORF type:complete len:160 (+),score=31.99 TRINITY_DN704_c0_g1_i1:155-634(+)